jgi:hypothetical protein
MATIPTINLGGNLPPEILGQQQALNRQQQMAQLLMAQGQQTPQGQMVSGRYVPPAFTQNLAKLANIYVGKELAEQGDKKALDLAAALRKQYADEMENYVKIQRGQEATPEKYTEMAGPYGESVGQNNTDIPMPVAYKPAQAAVAPNPMGANLYGSTAYNPVLQQMAAKKLLEGPQWKEASKLDERGNTISGYVDMNAPSPETTFRPFAMTKMAISPEAQIRFADEGIGIPNQFRSSPAGQPPMQGQPQGQNAVQTPSQPVGGQPRPVSAQPVSAPLVNDPFKAPPPPPTLSSGKEIREWKAEQSKPLTGTAFDIVNGAKNYQKAVYKIQELFDQYTPEDMLKPNVRAIFGQAVENARLQGKEANKLGALTGPDYGILEKLVVDPTAFNQFLVDRSTINKLYNNERAFTSEIIKGTYETAQKAVPENLRPFVEVKPKELANKPESKDGKPKAPVSVQRGFLNGEPIEVRNKKWVYSKTGKAVE